MKSWVIWIQAIIIIAMLAFILHQRKQSEPQVLTFHPDSSPVQMTTEYDIDSVKNSLHEKYGRVYDSLYNHYYLINQAYKKEVERLRAGWGHRDTIIFFDTVKVPTNPEDIQEFSKTFETRFNRIRVGVLADKNHPPFAIRFFPVPKDTLIRIQVPVIYRDAHTTRHRLEGAGVAVIFFYSAYKVAQLITKGRVTWP